MFFELCFVSHSYSGWVQLLFYKETTKKNMKRRKIEKHLFTARNNTRFFLVQIFYIICVVDYLCDIRSSLHIWTENAIEFKKPVIWKKFCWLFIFFSVVKKRKITKQKWWLWSTRSIFYNLFFLRCFLSRSRTCVHVLYQNITIHFIFLFFKWQVGIWHASS